MKQLSVAKRYANALIQVAQEKGKLEEYYQELLRIEASLVGHSDLKIAMSSPVVSPAKKKAILIPILQQLAVSQEVINFIQVLLDQERVPFFTHMVLIYRDMADELLGRIRVEVKAAFPLGDKQELLKQTLEKKLNKKILIEEKTDPSLLGGMVLKIQDQVFDASLRRELDKLKDSITFQAVA